MGLYNIIVVFLAETAGNIWFRKMKKTSQMRYKKVDTTAFVVPDRCADLVVGLLRLHINTIGRPTVRKIIVDLTTISFVLLKYEMIWTRERLEHDWFIHKELWRIFDSNALVDFFHLSRKISCLTGATVKNVNIYIWTTPPQLFSILVPLTLFKF